MSSLTDVGSVDVVLTAGCNLSCSYCFQNAKSLDRRMSWDTLRGAIDLLLASKKKDIHLNFYGGEPLLELPLIRDGVAYAKKHKGRGRSIRFGIITNGTLLREETAEFLALNDFDTQISFDGVPAAQELRGRGTYKVLDALLARLRREQAVWFHQSVRISLTLLASTIPHLADSIRYFIKKGIQNIRISPSGTHDPNWKTEMIDDLDRQFAKIYRTSLAHWRRTGEIPLESFRRDGHESVHAPAGRSMCGVGRGEMLAVDVDGTVDGCLMFSRSYQTFPSDFLKRRFDTMRMGHFKDPGFSERLALYPGATRQAEIFDGKESKYSSYARCGECRYLDTCTVCPVTIGHIPGNTDPHRIPDFQCAYNLVYHKYRGRFPAVDDLSLLFGKGPLPGLMRELDEAVGSEP